jgi:hypothetical protein
MPRFPKKQAEIAALAEPLRRGLLANRPVYPKPPIHPIYLHFLGYEKYGVWLVLATVLTFVQLGNLDMGHTGQTREG